MLIDTHAHLNFKAFKKDIEEVIRRALDEGVEKIINVGANLSSSQKAVEIAQKYGECFVSVGVHPHHAESDQEIEAQLETLAKNPKVVAVGETGLDYHSYKNGGIANPQKQKEIFTTQLKLAQRLNLPVIFHCRDAHIDILQIIKASAENLQSSLRGVFHCFSGDEQFLKSVLQMGFYVGFDGNITYKNAYDLRELVRACPLEKLLLETDCPYLTPEPFRGLRNEPKNVKIIARAVAEIKELPFQIIEKQTTQNTHDLFRW